MREEILKKALSKVSTQSYWLGAIIGLLFGIALGFAVGYDFASDSTIVIPLTEGTKV
jgi:hypothetical protein